MATATRVAPAPSKAAGLAMVAIGGVLFGLNQPLSRVLIDGPLSAADMALARLVALAIAIGGWALVAHRRALPRDRELLALVAFGVLGIAVLQWTATEAIARMDAGVMLTFVYSASITTALFSRLVWKERQPPAVWVAMVVTLVGLALAVGIGGDALGSTPPAGIAFAVATSMLFAYYALHGARLLARHPMPVVLGVGATAATLVWGTTAAPLWAFPFGEVAGELSLGGRIEATTAPGLLMLGGSMAVGTILPYVLYLVGMGRVGPTLGVITGTMEPIVAVILSWIWLDQRLEPLQIVGCVLVIGAVVLVQVARATPDGEGTA